MARSPGSLLKRCGICCGCSRTWRLCKIARMSTTARKARKRQLSLFKTETPPWVAHLWRRLEGHRSGARLQAVTLLAEMLQGTLPIPIGPTREGKERRDDS